MGHRLLLRRALPALVASAAVIVACAKAVDDPIPIAKPDEEETSTGTDASVAKEVETTCTLGTVEHCGECNVKCPGADDEHTTRTCRDATRSATCELICHGEFYDVDGKLENGCEAEDSPVQDSAATAVAITLPDVVNDATMKSNPYNVTAAAYHDGRYHDDEGGTRSVAREDWFRVTAVGAGNPANTMTACLSAVSFPTDNELEVCITANGATNFTGAVCKTLVVTPDGGGGSQCVNPPGNPNNGTFLVRVRKTKGAPTANKYALFLNH
ncbi:MAG: hypothetical protein JST00_14675 [Deltaproteobacteria bacterium]|nr:hypothetical protein [Deltaproteobacteria bacterium]